ncbi:tRNA pseudouridine(13) synthase TruD [Candidatus Uhrbacteria bacterium]|nr:tRNA pseudouridine(13) synthase TruD [Candidatus Uhrbacteria bacterium]
MAQVQDQNFWEREQKVVQAAREAEPEKFVGSVKDPYAVFEQIGIKSAPRDLPKGYFKYRPEDFIVEEVRPDGSVITVDGQDVPREMEGGEGTVYFDLTKVGVSTMDAGNRISEITGHPQKDIGYAGIKDAVALTSQRMSLRSGILNEVLMLQVPGTIVRNVYEGKGVVQIGGLKGNRFTLLIRTSESLGQARLDARMAYINSHGIMNYFGVQRFGTPRFLAHEFGRAMLLQGAEAGVKAYITMESPFELPYFAQRRSQATAVWGDWKKMAEVLADLPYTFRHELDMLESLQKTGGHFMSALEKVGQQGGMWVRAYASYAANERLSQAEQNGEALPDPMPQLLNPDPSVLRVYAAFLEREGLRNPMGSLKKYNFIRVGRNPTFVPVIRPEVHGYKIIPEGLAITFSLPKGAYATTMLMYLFDTVTGYPVPEWLNPKFIDTKEVLGTGSLAQVRELLGADIERMMARKNEDAGESGEE